MWRMIYFVELTDKLLLVSSFCLHLFCGMLHSWSNIFRRSGITLVQMYLVAASTSLAYSLIFFILCTLYQFVTLRRKIIIHDDDDHYMHDNDDDYDENYIHEDTNNNNNENSNNLHLNDFLQYFLSYFPPISEKKKW